MSPPMVRAEGIAAPRIRGLVPWAGTAHQAELAPRSPSLQVALPSACACWATTLVDPGVFNGMVDLRASVNEWALVVRKYLDAGGGSMSKHRSLLFVD